MRELMEGLLFDTHAHLDDSRFDEDRATVLQNMKQTKVGLCVSVGADLATSRAARDLAAKHAEIYFAAGIHPHEAKHWQDGNEQELTALLSDAKCVALGETGLDYYYDHSPKTDQVRVFELQLDIARRSGKPGILHVRDAHDDALGILRTRRGALPHCVVHCFTGNREIAGEYLDLGCMVSFAGQVTFKNARDIADAARFVPLDRLMIETDCPYLAPEPYRGRRNEPAFLAHICARIAQLRGVSEREIQEATLQNGKNFYNIQ